MTEQKIRNKYTKLHDKLTASHYGGTGGLTKEQFDTQHAKIWTDMETELITGGFIQPPQPERKLAGEIDELKAKVAELEKKVK